MDGASAITARRIRVTGKVQGVFFRRAARQEAESWGLAGWVRNEDDGSVTLHVEGDAESVDRFLPWCSHGPPRAMVASVEIDDVAPTAIDGFHLW